MNDATVEAVTVEADYRRVDGGWSTTVTAPQLGTRTVAGARLREVFEAVVAVSTDAAGRLGRDCHTVHRLAGETAALAALAAETGIAATGPAGAGTGTGTGPASGQDAGRVVTLSSPVATGTDRPAPRARCPYAPRS